MNNHSSLSRIRNLTSNFTQPDVRKGNVFSAILIFIYCFLLFSPSLKGILRFYYVFLICFTIFIFDKARFNFINFKEAKTYFYIVILIYIGSILSLFRTGDMELSLYNSAGIQITLFTIAIIIPMLATETGKRAVVLAIITNAIFVIITINNTYETYGSAARLKFVDDLDKNALSLYIQMAALVCFVLCLAPTYMFEQLKINKLVLFLLRFIFFVFAIAGAYFIGLTYSRSGLITWCLGMLSVILFFLRFNRTATNKIITIFSLIIIVFSFVFFLPYFLEENPFWVTNFERLMNIGHDDNNMWERTALFKRAIDIIVENPLVGVGLEGSKYYNNEDFLFGRLAHNSYLSDWADLGIFGLIINVIFLFIFYKEVKTITKINNPKLLDIVLLIGLYPSFFIMRFFLDVRGLFPFMLALLVSFSYGRKQ